MIGTIAIVLLLLEKKLIMHKISNIILDTQPRLSKLMREHDVIEKIKGVLQEIELFKKHADHYRVIKYAQSILYLSVSTAAFATQIRYSSAMILQSLRNKMSNIEFNALQCKVSTTEAKITQEPTYRKNKAKPMSAKIKNRLMQLSEKIDTEKLSEALKKLVR